MSSNAMMDPARRTALLTSVEKPRAAKAKVHLTRREVAARVLRQAVRRWDGKLSDIGDHGQVSRQIDDKENLSFHHLFAVWPPEFWVELIPLLAREFGGEVSRDIRMPERSRESA